MDCRKTGNRIFVRIDDDEEILSSILAACKKYDVGSAIYHGIGACSEVKLEGFENGQFVYFEKHGLLQIISMEGNVVHNTSGELHTHCHALFLELKDGKQSLFAGHVEKATVSYTGEFVVESTGDVDIGMTTDPRTGTAVWSFSE